ncbi:low specificity L-threonine aldolase [Aquicoccus sp. SCR17]|nr:low specificity L-threonine aldolase [Carideicomes alvinocaridis]
MSTFLSDNTAGAHPRIARAVMDTNEGHARPYGDDAESARLDRAFSELFEREVAVIPCTSGTAANALALSLILDPTEAVCLHAGSHVYGDECNAPEFFSGGARLHPVDGAEGKLAPEDIRPALTRRGDRHAAQPAALSIAQPTETGAVYSLDELQALGRFAREESLAFHMDGARFGNAVAALGCSPAEATWKAGVDLLSFGATKNGCFAAEAVVLFDPALAARARFRAKRAGQVLSKMRFLSTQLLAYVEDGLWLDCAARANAKAQALADVLEARGATLQQRPDANILFAHVTAEQARRLEAEGLAGYEEDGLMRFCTSWATTDAQIEAVGACLADRGETT